jgi:hypothetical protein
MKYLLLIFCLVLCTCGDRYNGDCAGGKAGKMISLKSSPKESGNSNYDGCDLPPSPDNIKLSSEKLRFNAEGGIDSITTEGEHWYMTTLEIGDTIVFLQSNEYYIRGEIEDLHLYESGIIFINEENGYDVMSIDNFWFAIDKPDKKKIVFSVKQNETEKEREFSVFLVDSRNSYNTSINVKQSK